MNRIPKWEDVVKAREELSKLDYEYWRSQNLFSFGWWFLVAMAIISAFVWWKWVEKNRILEVLTFCLLINVIASTLDYMGTQLMLWGYSNKVLPLIPPLLFVNYITLPTIYSLFYQYCPRWKTFIWGIVVMSTVLSFLAEPFLVWLKIYDMHNWRHMYSFPLYILLGICVKALVNKLMKIE